MLPPSDMEEIFRRVYFGTGGCSTEITPLTYPQFTNAINMTALALYDQKKHAVRLSGRGWGGAGTCSCLAIGREVRLCDICVTCMSLS